MHSDELLVPDENDDPSEMSEFGRLADFISGRVPEKEFRNFGAVNRRKNNCHHMGLNGGVNSAYLSPIVKMLSTDR